MGHLLGPGTAVAGIRLGERAHRSRGQEAAAPADRQHDPLPL